MTPPLPSRRRSKTPPPGETGQEALYLRSLSDRQVQVTIKLRDGETVRGWIEYFDDGMLRLTREGKPNLFIYKHQIRTITESGRRPAALTTRGPRSGGTGRGAGQPVRCLNLSGFPRPRRLRGKQERGCANSWPRAWRRST